MTLTQKRLIFIIPLFIIIPAVMVITFSNKALIIFPNDTYRQRITTFIDSEDGGKSEIIDFSVLYNRIIFIYTLKKGHPSPYAGLSFDVSLIDISSYEIMEMQVVAAQPVYYLLTFQSFIDNESKLSEINTMTGFKTEITLKETKQRYRIDLNSLIPVYSEKKEKGPKNETNVRKSAHIMFLHFSETTHVDGTRRNDDSLNNTNTIIVEKIAFTKSCFIYYIMAFLITILYYTCLILFILIRKKTHPINNNSKPDGLPHIKLEVESNQEKEIKKIIQIFKDNIFNPAFSVHMVYTMTGISVKKILKLIKHEYNLSFKQLVTCIRLNEAKRLLLESDLKIYDICFKIGYNNYTYFCTLFKNRCGLTPKEFKSGNVE